MNQIDKLCATLNTLGVDYEFGYEGRTEFPYVRFEFGEHGKAYFNMEFGTPWVSLFGDVKSLSDVAEVLVGRTVS